MKALPVITRELRSQARQPMTFSLRILGVGALVAMVGVCALGGGFLPGQGAALFNALHLVLFWAIWILVPLSVSDCLSREQREDTLGLLFLTPLTARNIVFAKALAHGWRALTLWLAALPVLVLPFLLGGLPWQSVVISCAINFSSIALALAVSMLASSQCLQWHRALVLTGILAIGLLFFVAPVVSRSFFLGTVFRNFVPQLWAMPGQVTYSYVQPMPPGTFTGGGRVMMAPYGGGSYLPYTGGPFVLGGGLGARTRVLVAAGQATVLALLAALGMMLLAARNVRERWRHQGRSARAEKVERVFCTPILFRSLLSRWMRYTLARNPIGWLERRRWSGRVVTWAWFAAIISVYSAVLSDPNFFSRSSYFQLVASWLLMGSVASTAAGSFRRERESGVLELLLVAPLTTGQIIWGRLRGIWAQFLPAVAMLLGLWLYLARLYRVTGPFMSAQDDLPTIGHFAMAFVSIPVVGLYFSLCCRHYIGAFLMTLAFGMLLPWVTVMVAKLFVLTYWPSYLRPRIEPFAYTWIVELLLAAFFGSRLHHRLEARSFPFSRAQV